MSRCLGSCTPRNVGRQRTSQHHSQFANLLSDTGTHPLTNRFTTVSVHCLRGLCTITYSLPSTTLQTSYVKVKTSVTGGPHTYTCIHVYTRNTRTHTHTHIHIPYLPSHLSLVRFQRTTHKLPPLSSFLSFFDNETCTSSHRQDSDTYLTNEHAQRRM